MAVAIGNNAKVENAGGAVAIGQNAEGKAKTSVAIGSYSRADVAAGQIGYLGDSKNDDVAWKSSLGAFSVGTSTSTWGPMTRQITNLAAGTQDTDAVNVAQLKVVNTKVDKNSETITNLTNTVNTGAKATKVTVNGKGDNSDNADANLKIKKTEKDGQTTYDLSLNDEITIGKKGTPGEDGAPGKDGVAGKIGINGKDGKSADITVGKGKDGVDGKNGENGITRIIYKDQDNQSHEVATLDDGLKFKGDNNDVVIRKLNTQLNIIGGATADLSDGNIGVVGTAGDNGGLEVKLSKNLKGLTSAEFKDGDNITNITGGNISITKKVNNQNETKNIDLWDLSTTVNNFKGGFTIKDTANGTVDVTLGETKPAITFKAETKNDDGATSALTAKVDDQKNVTYTLNTKKLKEEMGLTKGVGSMSSWKLKATKDTTSEVIADGDEVEFAVETADKGLTVKREGKKIQYGINADKLVENINSATTKITNVDGDNIDLSKNTSITTINENITKLAGKATKVTVNGKDDNSDDADANLKIKKTEKDGQLTYDLSLNDEITIGKAGKNGKDGKIGINGKDGKSADITVGKGEDGVDGTNGENGITRIIYKDQGNQHHEVATLDDGLKFKGDNDGVVIRKLNTQLNITGGATATDLSDGNIGVVGTAGDNGGLAVKLSKTLKGLASAEFKDGDNITNITGENISITKKVNNENKTVNLWDLSTTVNNFKGGFTIKDSGNGTVDVTLGEKTKPAITFKAETKDTDGATSALTANVDANKNVTYTLNTKKLKEEMGLTKGVGSMSSWKLKAGTTDAQAIADGDEVEFAVETADKGLTVKRDGKNIQYGINADKLVENINSATTKITNVDGDNIDLSKNTSITEINKKITNLGESSAWTLAVARGDDSTTDAEATAEGESTKVSGGTVTLKAGRGIKLKQDSTNIQIGLKFIDMDPAGNPFNDAKASGGGSLAVGQNSVAKAHQATAVGLDTEADEYGVALGTGAKAGNTAVAVGNKALANGDGSIAIGTAARKVKNDPSQGFRKVDSEDAIAIGTMTAVDGESQGAAAVGAYAEIVKSKWSNAFGTNSIIENSDFATILGNAAKVKNAMTGTALGNGASVSDAIGGVALGAFSLADRKALVLGYNPVGEQWEKFTDYLKKTGKLQDYKQARKKLKEAEKALEADSNNVELEKKVEQAQTEVNKTFSTWAGVQGAVSIGNEEKGITRQLTGVAAGTKDTDAVNVAQLKAFAAVPMNFYFGGVKDKNNVYTPGSTNWSMPLNEFRMDFGDGLKAEKVEKDGKTYTLVTLDKDTLKNDPAFKGDKGENGKDGINGKSAFELWKEQKDDQGQQPNKDKTEKEFLEGLKGADGAKGADGTNGKSAFELWKEQKDDQGQQPNKDKTEKEFFDSLKGEKGDPGTGGSGTAVEVKDDAKSGIKVTSAVADGKTTYTVGIGDSIKVGDRVTIDTTSATIGDVKIDGTANQGTITGLSNTKWDGQRIVSGRAATEDQLQQATETIQHHMVEMGQRVDHVGAKSAALAALHPLDYDADDKWDFSAAVGNYNGASSVALGAFYRPNERTMISMGGTLGGEDNMVNLGVSLKTGSGVDGQVYTSRTAMAKEIKALKEKEAARDAVLQQMAEREAVKDAEITKLKEKDAQREEQLRKLIALVTAMQHK